MSRRNFSWMAVVGALTFCVAPAFADLCPQCRNRSHTKDIGSCKLCDGRTDSGEFALCMDCSDRLQECEQCRKALLPKAPKIDEKQSGIHKYGRWVYEYTIANEGSKSEGYSGKLSYFGKPLPEPADINDYLRTPWGPMHWVGQPVVAFGSHGWMLRPKPSKPLGRLIQPTVSANPDKSAANGKPKINHGVTEITEKD